jgi:hypothetical protein
MAVQKQYFYFRFRDDFFNCDTIFNMLRVPIYGEKFIVILLILYARSTQNGGVIRIMKTFPEDTYVHAISKLVGYYDDDVIALALRYFIENDLLEVLETVENFELNFSYVKNNTGQSSKKADEVRALREKKKALGLPDSSGSSLESQSRSLPEHSEEDSSYGHYGTFRNVLLTSVECEELSSKFDNAAFLIDRVSIEKKQQSESGEAGYADVLEMANELGRKKSMYLQHDAEEAENKMQESLERQIRH